MLNPSTRILLFDALKPPEGYKLDHAIGTSFTLDLTALLTIPMAFSLFDLNEAEAEAIDHNFALLESLRRFTDKITVFCQAGDIHIPSKNRLLFTYLENVVFAVSRFSEKGIFHPKIWLLRFSNSSERIKYRLLCLSRNISFDPSWDICLTLDGDLMDRKNAYSCNHPLGDFIKTLPKLAVCSIPQARKQKIEQMQIEIRRVKFESSDSIDSYEFWPMGIKGHNPWFFKNLSIDELLVVSPFLSEGFLDKIQRYGKKRILVSNLESLIRISPRKLEKFEKVYYLANNAIHNDDSYGSLALTDNMRRFNGLHAKIFVIESGWYSHIFVGSANATEAAFTQNVEFMTKIKAKKSKWGIKSLLRDAEQGETTFRSLLLEYRICDSDISDELQDIDIESDIDAIKRILAAKNWYAKISPVEEDNLFNVCLRIEGSWPEIPQRYVITCWPITLKKQRGVIIDKNRKLADFEQISFRALTSFFGFSISIRTENKKIEKHFVVNAQIEGMPEDRKERVLRALISDRSKFIKFLLFILAEKDDQYFTQIEQSISISPRQNSGFVSSIAGDQTLLESLIKALSKNPERIDEIAELLSEIKKMNNEREIIPDGFEQIWKPIWNARQGLEE